MQVVEFKHNIHKYFVINDLICGAVKIPYFATQATQNSKLVINFAGFVIDFSISSI